MVQASNIDNDQRSVKHCFEPYKNKHVFHILNRGRHTWKHVSAHGLAQCDKENLCNDSSGVLFHTSGYTTINVSWGSYTMVTTLLALLSVHPNPCPNSLSPP